MPDITISGTLISFPDTAAEPDWSPAVIQFAESVEGALSGVVGPNDISPQVYTMVADTNSNVSLPGLQFPTSQVRAAFIKYSVYRTSSAGHASEAGTIYMVYDANNSVNQKWEWTQEKVGEGSITFSVLDTGQVQFSSTALGGTGHVGKISFKADALQQI